MKFTRLIAIFSAFMASNAFAHSGHSLGDHAFLSGFLHPFTGLDHLVMLVGLGVLIGYFCSNKTTKINKWALSAIALVSLTLGLVSGVLIGALSGIELAITASIFVVAIAIWNVFSASQIKAQILVFVSIGLVFFHGFAHGVEATGNLMGFALGMLVAASMLIALGERVAHFLVSKWLAAGVAASGLALLSVF